MWIPAQQLIYENTKIKLEQLLPIVCIDFVYTIIMSSNEHVIFYVSLNIGAARFWCEALTKWMF